MPDRLKKQPKPSAMQKFRILKSIMLTIEKCKEILNRKNNKEKDSRVYSDEEIIKIRDFFYHLAKIDLETFRDSFKKAK